MKFFIDTADIAEIRDLAATGLVDGVTTNPSLIARTGRRFTDLVAEICETVAGPVSAEVTATESGAMLEEAHRLHRIADNVVIKLPLTEDGLKACRTLSDAGIETNVTLCFSSAQAILAAKAGARYISPFIGRLDDISCGGMQLIADIVDIYSAYPAWRTEVLVASIRRPQDVVEAARLGADVATLPPKVLKQMFAHPLTDSGLKAFLADWEKTGQSILR